MRNITIVGAGAMGCLFAARLAEAGGHVTLIEVDRGRIDALNADGITLIDDRGERTMAVRAMAAAAAVGPVDLLLLLTKGMHGAAAMRSVAHLAGPETYALTLQNGLGNAETIAAVLAPERILIGVTDFPADLIGPTRVASHGGGRIWLGAYAAGAEAGAEAAAALLTSAGMDARADPEVEVAVWEKVAFNAALNSLAAVTGLTVGGMDTPAGRRIAQAVLDEVVLTAAAVGVSLDRRNLRAKIAYAFANHRGHKASMLQDLLAGRRTEIESINGAVVAAAETAGVAAPVTSALADLVRLIEGAGQSPDD